MQRDPKQRAQKLDPAVTKSNTFNQWTFSTTTDCASDFIISQKENFEWYIQ